MLDQREDRILSFCSFPALKDKKSRSIIVTKQTRDIDPMLVRRWASVEDDGTALNQHWFKVSCLLEEVMIFDGCIFFTITR